MYSEHLQLAEYKVLPDFAIQAVLSQLCPHLHLNSEREGGFY